jgi:hypothetical protein
MTAPLAFLDDRRRVYRLRRIAEAEEPSVVRCRERNERNQHADEHREHEDDPTASQHADTTWCRTAWFGCSLQDVVPVAGPGEPRGETIERVNVSTVSRLPFSASAGSPTGAGSDFPHAPRRERH